MYFIIFIFYIYIKYHLYYFVCKWENIADVVVNLQGTLQWKPSNSFQTNIKGVAKYG